jgi:glycosyltransferase involved in cell wall biosynthesis
MKIAIIGIKGLPAKWGADRVVEAIIQRLQSRHEISIYCSSHEVKAETTYTGIHLIRVPCLRGKLTHMLSVDLLGAIHAVIFGHYDLIHMHNIETAFILPLLRLRYKVVSTAHGRIKEGSRWTKGTAILMRSMEYPFCWLSSIPTSVSSIDALEMSHQYGREILFIPNGVNSKQSIDLVSARSYLDSLHLGGYPYLICAAGRIIPLKGFHLLLQAIRELDKEYRLLIVGDLSHSPDYGARLKALADERIVFIPNISSLPTLLGLVKMSSLFVFPSMAEAMSMMLIEAVSIGVPLLCSDIPANTSILPKQALFFKSGNVEDLAMKLKWAITHPDDMNKRGILIQDALINNYSWDVVAAKYDNLYSSLEKKHAQ